jgi:hypothetical protein
VEFQAMGEPLVFRSAPLSTQTEITGPLALRLYVSSSTADADIFVTFQAWDPSGEEVAFQGTIDPHSPLALGCLRASHRKLDPHRSQPWRPYHAHDEVQPLLPGQIYALDVELWPTSIILPAGYTLSLTIGGHDFERAWPGEEASNFRGTGGWTHTDPRDRPPELFSGTTTVYSGSAHTSALLVPIVPLGQAAQRPPRADHVEVDVSAVAGDDVVEVLLVSERERRSPWPERRLGDLAVATDHGEYARRSPSLVSISGRSPYTLGNPSSSRPIMIGSAMFSHSTAR